MVNILLEGYDIDSNWLRGALCRYLTPGSKVAIVAFSFRDEQAKNEHDWESLYGKGRGKYYERIVEPLKTYGISENDITFVNYFADSKESAKDKVRDADIIYFPGGLPDRMMDRIMEFDLLDTLLAHDGVVMGYSAGAVIQLREYHLSPDEDYPEFGYYKGIPYLDGFYLEVHYEGTDVQTDSVRRIRKERSQPVYATHILRGAVIVEDGDIRTVGEVEIFTDH